MKYYPLYQSEVSSYSPSSGARGIKYRFVQLLQTLRLWEQRAKQRRDLARLDLDLLRDIGVAPEAADKETAKPFWRA